MLSNRCNGFGRGEGGVMRPSKHDGHPARHNEALERDEPSKATPAEPFHNPNDAGPIVYSPEWTRVCSDASSTAMQWLRPLRNLGCPVSLALTLIWVIDDC